MRIITWNCQGGFRHKAEKIVALQPDIAIVQECEASDRLHAHEARWSQLPLCWHGDNPRGKGVAVFASSGHQLTIDPIHDPSIKYVVPISNAGQLTSIGPLSVFQPAAAVTFWILGPSVRLFWPSCLPGINNQTIGLVTSQE